MTPTPELPAVVRAIDAVTTEHIDPDTTAPHTDLEATE